MTRFATTLLCAAILAAASPASWAADAALEREIAARIERLRAVKAEGDAQAIEQINRQMDEAWKYYDSQGKEALAVLNRSLASELARPRRNNLVLLDTGSYLFRRGGPEDKDRAIEALLALDTGATIVRWNSSQLFHLAHAVAASRDPRILPFLDKAFLRGKVEVIVPQHAMTLGPTLSCVFVYGVYGKGAEERLRAALADPAISRKALEVLIWIGSPASNAAVRDALAASGDYDTLARAVSFLMQAGGPEGRAMLLAVNPARLDAKARDYYAKVRPDIEKAGAREARAFAEGFPGERKLSDEEVKKRLAAMRRNAGKDESTNPVAILDSTLPREFLIGELTDIRALTLNRISDEALSDVQVTNAILNSLRYRER